MIINQLQTVPRVFSEDTSDKENKIAKEFTLVVDIFKNMQKCTILWSQSFFVIFHYH